MYSSLRGHTGPRKQKEKLSVLCGYIQELTMPTISSIAIRVSNVEAMVAFYSEAFQVQFREVDTYGIRSQFGDVDGITLKLVPIRDDSDFKGYPVHQPGFVVPDVEAVIDLAIELYSEE
jgi:hypothetical protein